MLMNPRSVGGFDMDAVEESWISTIGVTTQVATRRDWRGVSSSVAVSCVDIADAFPETVVLDQCGHNRAHLPPTGHCAVQFEQCAMQFGVTFFDFGVMVCTRSIGFK